MLVTLKTKIWLTVFIIVLVFSFFTLLYFPGQQERYFQETYNNDAQNLARTVALGVKIAFDEENYEGLNEALNFAREDPRLKFVRLLYYDSSRTGSKVPVIRTVPEKAIPDTLKYPKGSVIARIAPFKIGTMSGNILLAFSTEQINRSIRHIRVTSLAASAIVFFISVFIGFWLSRNISVPVLALRDAAKRVGEGDLTQKVNKTSTDEIGELADAFNKMVEDLANAGDKLKKANAGLEAANQTLKDTLENLKDTQDKLLQAEKMASLGQLTAGIAHEINNPINFVSANIQPLKNDMADLLKIVVCYEKVIKEKKLENEFVEIQRLKSEIKIELTTQEINDMLKGIEEGAIRTSEIIKGLRNFSRMDQNVLEKANLNNNLESTLTLLHSTYKNRIEIVKQYGEIPEIECFPGQINQVFMNILSNAIQAIPQEGSIFIKTWLVDNVVKISIKDTGTGMPEAVIKKIFDPFFTTKEVGKGTGLGLSISYGIMEKHNGEIEVFSNPGQGTEFILSIPIRQPKIK